MTRQDLLLYLLNLIGEVTLAASLGLLAAAALRRRSAPLRQGILLAVLILVAAAPLTAWTAGRMGLGLLRLENPPSPKVAARPAATWSGGSTQEEPVRPAPIPAGRHAWPWKEIWLPLGLAAWTAGSAVALARLAGGWCWTRDLRRSLKTPGDSRLVTAAGRAAAAFNLVPPPPVGISSWVRTPLSVGFLRPTIVIPEILEYTLGEPELEGILIHETAHIAHHHHEEVLLQRLVGAAFWWHPLVSRLNDRLGEIQEEICDNHVVKAQHGGRGFARCLVEIARHAADMAIPAGARALTHPGPSFETRVRILLAKERNTMTRMSLPAVTLVALLTLGTWTAMLGCNFAQPSSSPPSSSHREDRQVREQRVRAYQLFQETPTQDGIISTAFDIPAGFKVAQATLELEGHAGGRNEYPLTAIAIWLDGEPSEGYDFYPWNRYLGGGQVRGENTYDIPSGETKRLASIDLGKMPVADWKNGGSRIVNWLPILGAGRHTFKARLEGTESWVTARLLLFEDSSER